MKVLVIEDDSEARNVLVEILEDKEYSVVAVSDGLGIAELLDRHRFDIVLLDYLLPGRDGRSVLRDIRSHKNGGDLAVIMLTGVTGEADTLKAFDLGVDDYVTKPFLSKVLLARMAAVERRLRKGEGFSGNLIVDKNLKMDLGEHQVFYLESKVDLTLTEFKILKELLYAKGNVVSRDNLKDKTLNSERASQRTVDVHVTSLRKKLKDYGNKIKTVRGVGYRFAS